MRDAHDLVHRLGHRGDAKIQIQPLEHGKPGGELGDELERLAGVGVDQRLPARRVGHADLEVHSLGDSAQRHLAGNRHGCDSGSNNQSLATADPRRESASG